MKDQNVVMPVAQRERNIAAPRGRTLWNAFVRLGSQFVVIAANLLITPYIVRQIGVEAYGIVGVVNTAISFMAVATTSLIATTGRNLTFAVERGESEKANQEISTAVYGTLSVLLLAALPVCGLSLFIDRLIVIPPGLLYGARILFILAFVAFAFSTLSGPLGAAMFVRNRLDLFSIASLGRSLFFIAAIIALFSAAGAGLAAYGTALLAAAVLLCLAHLGIHRHLLPGVVISRRWFDRAILREVLSLGGWMSVAQIGGLLFLQTDLLVANRVLGPVQAGQLAAISVISLQLRALSSLVSGLFAPNQTALWAQGNKSGFSAYLFRSIRLTTLFMALLVGVFCGSAREVLDIWLGTDFGGLSPVAIMLTGYLIISLGIMPSWNAVLALGKVKVPALVTLIMGIGNVALSVILAGRMGLMGIALSGCIMLTLRNTIFTPWYVSRTCNVSLRSFWRELGLGAIYGAVVFLISSGVNSVILPDSMSMLLVSLLVAGILSLALLAPLGLRELRRMPTST